MKQALIVGLVGFLFLVALTVAAETARACDLCGCYTPQSADMSAFGQPSPSGGEHGSWLSRAYFAVAQQFTHFGTVQVDGREVPNPTGQYEDSSIIHNSSPATTSRRASPCRSTFR